MHRYYPTEAIAVALHIYLVNIHSNVCCDTPEQIFQKSLLITSRKVNRCRVPLFTGRAPRHLSHPIGLLGSKAHPLLALRPVRHYGMVIPLKHTHIIARQGIAARRLLHFHCQGLGRNDSRLFIAYAKPKQPRNRIVSQSLPQPISAQTAFQQPHAYIPRSHVGI